ncbi:MAG: VanZ family protein [Lachnospiraceae bacterium]|nr:VanZ family protein [Lachnospiraceae bacterium]
MKKNSDGKKGSSDNGGSKKKRPNILLLLILWLLFLGCTALICYLSFENGDKAKELGSSLTLKLAQWNFQLEDVPEEALTGFTYKFRQLGRLLIFFVLGVIGTGTIHYTLRSARWIIRSLISTALLIGIAVFTERYKLHLPTRHYSADEMMISIIGVLLGFLFVSFVTLVVVTARRIASLRE